MNNSCVFSANNRAIRITESVELNGANKQVSNAEQVSKKEKMGKNK